MQSFCWPHVLPRLLRAGAVSIRLPAAFLLHVGDSLAGIWGHVALPGIWTRVPVSLPASCGAVVRPESGPCFWVLCVAAACARAVAPPCLQAQRPACASRRPFHPPGPPGSGVPRASPCVLPAAPLTVFRSLLSCCPFTHLLLWESSSPARPASLLSWWELGQRCPLRPSGVQRPPCVPRVSVGAEPSLPLLARSFLSCGHHRPFSPAGGRLRPLSALCRECSRGPGDCAWGATLRIRASRYSVFESWGFITSAWKSPCA